MAGFIPTARIVTDPAMLYIAIGILGATVMPHNLYLHSSVVQTRAFDESEHGKRDAIRMATIDSTVALFFAFFINAAILIVAAATFHVAGRTDVAEIDQAYRLLAPMLGAGAASVVFGVALLASGQNSTVTGTLAGQIVMEGFLDLRLAPGCGGSSRAGWRSSRPSWSSRQWSGGGDQAPRPQPGDPQPPAALRSGAAGPLHRGQGNDGAVRQSRMAAHLSVDHCGDHHRA